MLLFAASVIEQTERIPPKVWLNLGLALLVIIGVIVLIRIAASVNKFVLGGVILMAVIVIGFQWIYERNEPAFLTPAINAIAPFFPGKPDVANPPAPKPGH